MNLLSLVPLPYRLLMLVGLALAAGGFCYVKGLTHSEAEHAKFVATVQAAGEAQNAKTAVTIKAQKQINLETSDETTQLRTRLSAALAAGRVPRINSGGIKLPSVPGVAGSVAPATAQPGACPAGNTTLSDNAAQDALTILLLQKWVDDQAEAMNGSAAPK